MNVTTAQPQVVYQMPACGICCLPICRVANRNELPKTCCLVPTYCCLLQKNPNTKSIGCCGFLGWGVVAMSGILGVGAGAGGAVFGAIKCIGGAAVSITTGGSACFGATAALCSAYKVGIMTCATVEESSQNNDPP